MLFMVAAMAAEMERDLIRERTLDGLRAAEAQGRRDGRRPAVDRDVPAVVRARQSRGESITAIARHLKIGPVDAVPGTATAREGCCTGPPGVSAR